MDFVKTYYSIINLIILQKNIVFLNSYYLKGLKYTNIMFFLYMLAMINLNSSLFNTNIFNILKNKNLNKVIYF